MTKAEFIRVCQDQILAGKFFPVVMAANCEQTIFFLINPTATDTRAVHSRVGEEIAETLPKPPTLIVSAFDAWISRHHPNPTGGPGCHRALGFSAMEYVPESGFKFTNEVYEVTKSDLVLRSIKRDGFKDDDMQALCQALVNRAQVLAGAR